MIANPPRWPNGARCAAAITFDIDAESVGHLVHRENAGKRTAFLSWERYDEIAVTRILDMYKRHGIKQTFFMPGWCIEHYPAMVEAILNGGHEIAIHGYIHEEYDSLTHEDERRWFERSLESYATRVGGVPLGFRAPLYRFSDYTADLLAEKGILYDSTLSGDDVPYLLRSRSGDVIELPAESTNDDWIQYVWAPDANWVMQIKNPDEAIAVFRAELEAAHEYGGLWITIWHPTVSGRLSRAMRVERLIELMESWGDVWLAPLGEIAKHIRKIIDDGSYKPRVEKMPLCEGLLKELSD